MIQTKINIEGVENLHIHYHKKEDVEKDDINLSTPQKIKWWGNLDRANVLKVIDTTSKIVSIVAGVLFAVILISIVFGKVSIGQLKLDTLLAIVSVTFIGGIFSIGGLNLINLQSQLKTNKKILNKLNKPFKEKFVGLHNLSKGWHHYYLPSKKILIIYGHELETTIYRKNRQGEFKIIWQYNSYKKNSDRWFAQTIECFKDKVVAIGDYSTGNLTIFDLNDHTEKSVNTIEDSIYYIGFSEGGTKLVVASKAYNSINKNNVAIVDIERMNVYRIEGSGPVAWLNEIEFLYVQNKTNVIKYNINSNSSKSFFESELPINNINSSNNAAIISAGEYDKTYSLIYMHNNDLSPSYILKDHDSSFEHIEILDDKILISEGWNIKNREPFRQSSVVLMNLNGDVLSLVKNFAGYGHDFYKKYSVLKTDSQTLLATRGNNGVIPLYEGNYFREKYLLNFREHEQLLNASHRMNSVQINECNSILYLTALSENDEFIEIELREID